MNRKAALSLLYLGCCLTIQGKDIHAQPTSKPDDSKMGWTKWVVDDRPEPPRLSAMPWVDQVDPFKLEKLIATLQAEHGDQYASAEQHRMRLSKTLSQGDRNRNVLAAIQRDVLLFDVDRLLVIKRL
jgi:hypothetical protein